MSAHRQYTAVILLVLGMVLAMVLATAAREYVAAMGQATTTLETND